MAEYVRSFSESGNVQVSIQKAATANETYKVGEFLKMAGGKVTKASGTDKPEYICGQNVANTTERITVFPVSPSHEYKATFSAVGTAINEGDKVTISADGMNATATTASGVLTVTRKVGTGAVGDTVYFKI